MADFDFSQLFGSALDWAKQNPQLAGAAIGGIGSLIDPQRASVTTTQQNTTLPSYIAPYAQRMLGKFEQAADLPYAAYPGQRVADMNQTQTGVLGALQGMAQPNQQQQQASSMLGNVMRQQEQLNYSPTAWGPVGSVTAKLNPMNAEYGRFDSAAAQQYMNPYMQSVVDIQKREAERDYEKQLPVMAAQAQARGAFGGSRDAILQAEAQRNYNQRLGDIQATGLNQAYQQAQGQFNSDEGRRMQAQQLTEQSREFGANLGYQTQNANIQNELALRRMKEESRQFGANYNANTLQQAGNTANTLAGIGNQGFQNQLAAQQGILGIGNQQQATQQAGLNVGYQNFLDQRGYPLQQAQTMQGGLTNLPMTQYAVANATPAPSMTQQLLQGGLSGYILGGGR